MENNLNLNTKEGRAYLAGFVDADGSIIAQFVKRKDYRFKYQIRTTIQITQKTKRGELLYYLKQHFKCGSIRHRKTGVSDWIVVGENARQILEYVQPYLVLKQEQADLVLEIIKQLAASKRKRELQQFLEIAELAEQVSNLNDSKKRTHTFASVSTELKKIQA